MSPFDDVTQRAAPWIEALGRAGYASKGVVFVLVGVLTAMAAFHRRSGAADQSDAFRFVLHQPFGRPLLALIGVGLLGYAIWKIGSATGDWEARGSDRKGLLVRAFSALTGLLYTGIAIEVFRLAASASSGPQGSDPRTQHWTARALDAPLGRWLVGIAGLCVLGYGIQQLVAAWKAKLSDSLRLGGMSAAARRRIVAVSRFGIAARGVVFAIVGGSLVSAAIHGNASRARGTAGAMGSVSHEPFGQLLLFVIALGVVAYGLYAFVNARYRIIRAR